MPACFSIKEISVPDGAALFEAVTGMKLFSFTGGTLKITNPPFGSSSQAIKSAYDFGINSTLIIGDKSSNIAGKNSDGFGGLSFPNKIGKLIIDAGTRNGNRQLIVKKPLSVKGKIEVKAGSGVILQAPATVVP